MNGEPLQQSKIASGMEVYFVLTFKPQEVRYYSYDLICSTEREKFLVPVRAIGTRPRLTLPNEIDFGESPIKSLTQRKISVQNVGTAVARFNMRSNNKLFTCPLQDIAIEPGASESIEFYFKPADTEAAEGEIQVDFVKGVTCFIRLIGVGRNADVSLSTPSLSLESSYISLLSQKSLRIRNNSDTPISYMWKSFANAYEEELERSRLLHEINRMEDIEYNNLRQSIQQGYNSSSTAGEDINHPEFNLLGDNGDTSGDNADTCQSLVENPIPQAAKDEEAKLVRKYRLLRNALEKDEMRFVDDIFEISPILGQVWAHSEIEISVCFRPDTAAFFNCLGYLEVDGREDRLPLQLSGQGIGPNAYLSFEVLDLGDVFINEERKFDMKIRNKGDIPAQWTFIVSLTKFGNKFKFSPTEGFLKPGLSETIQVSFESDMLGEFVEHFHFALQGNEEKLTTLIKGSVIGPSFHFDVTTIDFGTVSYDYLHTVALTMVNTSSIPMDFSLHIPQDGLSFMKKEFNITPSVGKLSPGESIDILLEFIPTAVKVYEYSLCVDVLGVGDRLLSIPILAECIVSSVKLDLPARELDFGNCYLRYPYEKKFVISNLSPTVHTKFEVMAQLKQTKAVVSFHAEPARAVIEPGDSMSVTVCLTALKLGSYKVPMTILVAGSNEPPLQAVIQFKAVGPKIEVDQTEMRWGSIECLKDSARTIRLSNTGLTDANMKLFLKMARSNYSLGGRHDLSLKVGDSCELTVVANLDDSVVCKDEMHVVVDEGDNLMVPLIAKGIGTTMHCNDKVDVMDLGIRLTNNPIEKKITLENKGRRPQQLRWYNRTIRNENTARMTRAKKEGKDTTQPKRLPKHLIPLEPMFTVTPEEIVLRPRTATTFTFRCYSNTPKHVTEVFVLESKVGKDRYMKEIMITELRCEIVNPLLEISRKSLDFVYTWERDVPPAIQKKEIALRNSSSLTLAFLLKTEIPFNLNTWEAVLEPGEQIEVTVDFDPIYKDEKQSHFVEKVLSINYRSHPQKDSLPLRAELIFPNLVFDQSAIQFGCVLYDTVKTMKLKATNSCKIPLNYEWEFIETSGPKHKSRGSVISISPTQVFDILPVRSMLLPGASEDVEFTMYGNMNPKLSGTVICVVEGGPEYSFPISGEASSVSFELNRSIIDFGKVIFTEKADEELEIINSGKVPFNFQISPSTTNASQVIQILTPSGKVAAGQTGKIIIRALPGMPSLFCEHLTISVAHFDSFTIPCYCQGIFPAAVIALPRYRKIGPFGETDLTSDLWNSFQTSVVAGLTSPDISLQPPSTPPPAASGDTTLPPVYEPANLPPIPPSDSDDANDNASGNASVPVHTMSGGSINSKVTNPNAVEVEMQRVVLVSQLSKVIASVQASNAELTNDVSLQADNNIESPTFGLQALVRKHINLHDIVAATYICDFGNVIAGQTKKKPLKVTNASSVGKLTWLFDKNYLSSYGYSIEPEQALKLPEGETATFEVKFFARFNQPNGPRTYTLPLLNFGSPRINIILNANVCVPDVDLSSTQVDFGKVLIGQCKQMFVSLYNPTPVKTNWQIKRGSKDETKFKFEPMSGSVRPGKKMLVSIEFVPTDSHRYYTDVSIKIDQNKRMKVLKVVGEGFGASIKFDPPLVELGPILPYSTGDERTVTIVNSSDIDTEVYSVDFDGKYQEEEALLSQLTVFDEQGLFRTSLREAGDALPTEVQVAFQTLLSGESANKQIEDTMAANDANANTVNESAPKKVLQNAPVRTKPTPRDEKLHQDIVIFGPPISGVSSHAMQMSRKLVIPLKTMDQLIEEVAATNDPLYGFLARSCIKQFCGQELDEFKAKEEELLAIANQSKAVAEEAFKKDKANKKAKEVPAEVYNTKEVLAHKEFVAARTVTTESIANLIKFRMNWVDAERGVVIDGAYSKYMEPVTILTSLQEALPSVLLTHISIDRDEEGYTNWLSSLFRSKTDEVARLKRCLDGNMKLYKKLCKGKKKLSSRSLEILSLIDRLDISRSSTPLLTSGNYSTDEFPEAIPEGDEVWVNQSTGLAVELDPSDYRILDEKEEKFNYLEQLLYQYSNQIKATEKVLMKIQCIWNPDLGLLDSDRAKLQSEVPNTTSDFQDSVVPAPIFYKDYVEKILPVLSLLKHGTYGPSSSSSEGSIEAPVDSDPNDVSVVVSDQGGLYTISLDGDESEEAVFANINAIIPPPLIQPPDKDAIPAPVTFQVYRKPLQRPNRKLIKMFKIIPLGQSSDMNAYRWVIPANSAIQFKVQFTSIAEGKPESTMEFEIVGTNQKLSLYCKGVCELPKVNADTRNIFMRRVKGLNPNPIAALPNKRFVIAENFYSFGPLNLFKKPEWKKEGDVSEVDKLLLQQIESTNMDTLRFTNTGLYKCELDLGFLTKDEGSRDIFKVEPSNLQLEEGETKEVKLWALPKEVKEYNNDLVVSLTNNPAPTVFPIKCWGVEAKIDFSGQWNEGIEKAEQALAANTDKKLIKDLEIKLATLKEALTIDFERILLNKSETRSFTIKNTTLLPIQWEIDLGDFKDSENITIAPMSGVLPIHTVEPVLITFTSPTPLMLTGKFSFRYSDNEGGLRAEPTRIVATSFRVVAEAYQIIAVSLNSAGNELGGSEIDYGLIRVGDYAVQTLKMANKGKYQIGYAFRLSTSFISSLVKIEPMEGLIASGSALAEMKVTFCSKEGEVLLKNNKDVVVQIIEPITKEVVESFPLLLTAQVKYNKFRLQPSKGISFGAVRFDSEAKTKSVALRNEGSFEFTYVICPAQAEIDEIDSLDAAAFGCYAQAVPQAIRTDELGDGYLERIKGGAGAAGGKPVPAAKGKAPPPKKGAPVVATPTSSLNPLVVDSDELPAGVLPDDPLVVGAFTVLPRIGTVLPGQTINIDMKFDPSGCDTVKERMRLCISGVDPKDTTSQVIKTFEVTGESCVPAIVTDDFYSIFEEQEIVHSLADSTGDKSSEGGGKIEKLPVGKVVFAETEKMLAFGPVSCSSQAGKGVLERVRISNPTKIDIKVKFSILTPEEASGPRPPSAGAAKGKAPPAKGGKGAVVTAAPVVEKPNAFTVQPERWEIPPHEHRFVNVYFNPTEIKSYRSVFKAMIDDNGIETSAASKSANSGKQLTFDLGGSGTLPCIAFDQPTDFSADGNLLVNFSKVLVKRTAKRQLVLRNDGVMPTTCLFDIIGDDDFIFPAKGTSLTVNPGKKESVCVNFSPKEVIGDGSKKAVIKVSVLNNPFDQYALQLVGSSYSCDAMIDTIIDGDTNTGDSYEDDSSVQQDIINFKDINLFDGASQSSHTIQIRSQSEEPVKFELKTGPNVPDVLKISPSVGHLIARGTREVTITFSTADPVILSNAPIVCTLKRIQYLEDNADPEVKALWGSWDDSMKSMRTATEQDLDFISASAKALDEYNKNAAAELAKGKKGKPVGPPPPKCLLELGPNTDDGVQTIYETIPEPNYNFISDVAAQELQLTCNGTADVAKYTCKGNGENIAFTPTFLFQTTVYKFPFKNESNIKMPIKWLFEDMKRRLPTRSNTSLSRGATALSTISSIPRPFTIEPEEYEVEPKAVKEFTLKFSPVEVDDFIYMLRGATLPVPTTASDTDASSAGVRMIIRGTAKRPICHFDVVETLDYMSRRPLNMKNENGLNSPIEALDIKVVELESVGLRTRNTFRFYVTNTTNDNYEFIWESLGEASPSWRCVQGAGMMFAGKRIEIVFEYLPEEVHVAEAFFKFRIPSMGLSQMFLFTGKVAEPKVLFSTSKIDFHSVMLGGEGSNETIYLENHEHLPFQFAIDKYSLLQLDGPKGPVLDISPKEGTVSPYGKTAINLFFHPQEEVVYNFNIICAVKRKPNKLALNVKGEGYAVHPFIQLEQPDLAGASDGGASNRYITLRPAPAINYADFGSVQVNDTVSKTLSVTNNGKFNFDYIWDIDSMSSMLSLSGGKLGGTLLKAEELVYKLSFAPKHEGNLDGSPISFTVAGKYVFNIVPRGSGVKPALRFSFMHHEFGPCFVTSPGGSTVIEEIILRISNHDPLSNIAIECTFQKTRALWADCAPTVIAPGAVLEVPIRFAPREVKDYVFVVPFIINGSNKLLVNILGSGINARMELVNGSQRRTNFGLVDVGAGASRSVAIVNRSKKQLPVQLLEEGEYGSGNLQDRCVSFSPKGEFVIGPKETVSIQLSFNPTKRISQFTEDLLVRYAGMTRKLLNVSGKAQGTEIALDSDSLPFGIVVLDSQKIKKLTLENIGDLTITFQWMPNTFGQHFSISPLSGKILPGGEIAFDVLFKPKFADDDIRQDNMILMIPGLDPLKLTCTGSCILPPSENIQLLEFKSNARKAQEKSVKIQNPTDKDWYISPSLQGEHWKIPHEFKIPAKAAADLPVTYFPLTMVNSTSLGEEKAHSGQLFIALPDGSAQLYKLRGEANAPECSGHYNVETPAKKAATVILKVNNWLGNTQRLDVTVNIKEKPTPATFIVAANVTEIGPNGTKEFPLRYYDTMITLHPVIDFVLSRMDIIYPHIDSSLTPKGIALEQSPSPILSQRNTSSMKSPRVLPCRRYKNTFR